MTTEPDWDPILEEGDMLKRLLDKLIKLDYQ